MSSIVSRRGPANKKVRLERPSYLKKYKLTGRITPKVNGNTVITRCLTVSINNTSTSQWTLGAFNADGFTILFSGQNVTITTSTTNSVAYPIPNAAELTALYDQLKIKKVEVMFSCDHDNAVTNIYSSPKMIVANDYNDGATCNATIVNQLAGAKHFTAQGPVPFKWTCVPKYQQLVYYTAATSSFAPRTGFVNSDTDIPHYGIKVASALAGSNALAGTLYMMFKIFYELKDVK